MTMFLAHRSARYLAETSDEKEAVASRSKNISNNSTRRRHKDRLLRRNPLRTMPPWHGLACATCGKQLPNQNHPRQTECVLITRDDGDIISAFCSDECAPKED